MRYVIADDDPYRPDPVVSPPSSMTVDPPRKPVIYLPDGRAVVRQVGYAGQGGQ